MQKPNSARLSWPGGELSLEPCRVMGILNVTPDSFSDGGDFFTSDRAVARAWKMAEEGAHILDIGAESTRPGAQAVSEEEERKRLWPVLELLKEKKYPIPISLDCTKPRLVAEALRNRWVQIVNDVEGLRNLEMVSVVKEFRAPVIVMHMFGTPRTMQQDFHYDDVVKDLIVFFETRLEQAGIQSNIVIDPGIGFGKSVEHNLEILRRLGEFKKMGYPILIGASRKSFIGKILGSDVKDRLIGSLAAAAMAVQNGASILRVHDVKETLQMVRMISYGG